MKATVTVMMTLSGVFAAGALSSSHAQIGIAPGPGDQREVTIGAEEAPIQVKPGKKNQPAIPDKGRQPSLPGKVQTKPAATMKPTVVCQGKTATIVAESQAGGILNGTPGPDVIAGLGGADRIDGKGGDDLICGGGGDDVIRGGDGNDIIKGADGRDRLYGGSGNDELYGGSGRDILDGENGNDILDGGGGLDSCSNPGNYFDKTSGCENFKKGKDPGPKFGLPKKMKPEMQGFGSKVAAKPGGAQVLSSKMEIGKSVGDPQAQPSKMEIGKSVGDPQAQPSKIEIGKSVGDPQAQPSKMEIGKSVGDPQAQPSKMEIGKSVGDPQAQPSKMEIGKSVGDPQVLPPKVEIGEDSGDPQVLPPKVEAGESSGGAQMVTVLPQITSALPLPAGPYKFGSALGTLRPGFHLVLSGKHFGSQPGKILMCGNFPGGCVELEDPIWESDDLVKGIIPMSTNGQPNQQVKVRIVLPSASDNMFNVNVSNDHHMTFTGREQKDLAQEDVAVLNCGKDANYGACNDESWAGVNMWAGRGFAVGCPDCSIFGWHQNTTGAVGDDEGYDHFSISLKNGWLLKDISMSRQKSSGDDTVDPPTPSFPTGQSEWSPVVHWIVTPADNIRYKYRIVVEGPLGTSYR